MVLLIADQFLKTKKKLSAPIVFMYFVFKEETSYKIDCVEVIRCIKRENVWIKCKVQNVYIYFFGEV